MGSSKWLLASEKRKTWVEIDQGNARRIFSTLGIGASDLALGYDIQNSKTSRVKTTVPLKIVEALDCLQPQLQVVKSLCGHIGSTGLYLYAVVVSKGENVFSARQIPKIRGTLRMELPEVSSV